MDALNDPLALGPYFILPWLLFSLWLIGTAVLVGALAALLAKQQKPAQIEDPVVTGEQPH